MPSLRCLLVLNGLLLSAVLLLGLLLFTDSVHIPALRGRGSVGAGNAAVGGSLLSSLLAPTATKDAAAAAVLSPVVSSAPSATPQEGPSFAVPPIDRSSSEATAREEATHNHDHEDEDIGNGGEPSSSSDAAAAARAAPSAPQIPAGDDEAQEQQRSRHADVAPWMPMPLKGAQSDSDIPHHSTLSSLKLGSGSGSDDDKNAMRAVEHYVSDRHTSFMFPRPAPRSASSSLFVTSLPNLGAGVGHQFGEWVLGPWVALLFNATYLHTGFYGNGKRWNRFLGFGEGEDTVEDFVATYGSSGASVASVLVNEPSRKGVRQSQLLSESKGFTTLVRTWDDEVSPGGRVWHWMDSYLATQRRESLARKRQLASEGFVRSGAPLTAAHASLDPDLPTPLLVYFDEVHVHSPDILCGPDTRLLQAIRRKYCLARVKDARPLPDLYAADRARNYLVVALHLRCGDSCFDAFRTTRFESVRHTVQRMHALLTRLEPSRPLCFHIFSQRPQNGTAEDHFAPLLSSLKGLQVTAHFHASSYVTLHHLIKADVLLGAQSSFSWLAFLLHQGVSMGPFRACTHQVDYSKDNGVFDEAMFEREYLSAKRNPPQKFERWEDCMAIQPHVQVRPLKLDMK
jgi:hypothetical protein